MSHEIVHRLWALPAAGLAVIWAGHRIAGVRSERRIRRRLTTMLALEAAVVRRERSHRVAVLRRWLPPVGVASAGWVLFGGLTGVLAGLAGAVVFWRWRHRRGSGAPARGDEAGRGAPGSGELPLAADLLAACIAAGAGPVVAAQAVGDAVGGPFGRALACGAAEVRLGGDPSGAWRELAALPGAQGLARLLERAAVSGLPAAAPVARLAADARAEWTRAATARARRAAVFVTAPVGLCFLPAFIAVGVLPVVIGLAGSVLEAGR